MNKLIPLLAFSILLLVPLGAQNALAVNIGPNDAPPPFTTTSVEHPIGISNGWEVGPVEISHDPNAGPWEKVLPEDPNTPFPKVLIEEILVGSTSEPFSDWHEKIVDDTSCYVWSSSPVFFGQFLPPDTTVSATFSPDRKIVDWTFDPPIPAGHQFKLFKFFDCDLSVGPRTGDIQVFEYPTVPTNEIIGGEILDLDTMALFIGAIGVNPVITGLVAITMGGVAAQAIWYVNNRRVKKVE